MKDTNR